MKLMSLKCPECGKEPMSVNITEEQYSRFKKEHIQDVLPELNVNERERFVSGLCSECWDKIFIDE